MDFQLSEEQQMLKDSARRYLEPHCGFQQRGHAPGNGADSGHWQAFAEMGWLGMALPEEAGGLGAGLVESAILMEEIGRVLCVEPYWAVAMLTAQTLLATGDAAKCEQLLPALVAGEARPVLAHGEAAARGVVEYVGTSAAPAGPGRWRLHGHKVAVVGANLADRLVVSARTAGSAGQQDGISLFLVDPKGAGVNLRPVRLIDNRWAADIDLGGVEVGQEDIVGTLGGAYPALLAGHEYGLLGLCAEALGVMEQAMWITRDYLKVRQQFGVALSTFQSLQHRMSEMLIELELSRGMVHRALAAMAGTPEQRKQALAAAKVHIGRSGQFVCGQAIQLHGGIGVTEEYVIGHHFKRMTCIEHALGNAHFHLERLADIERAAAG